ncbi:hypothetical protein HK098_006597 [Nowakowskiella sp. JEL0407]|nr:hypothetical protein HK098_006597 [Nowakowskiella sp. JEL0407]
MYSTEQVSITSFDKTTKLAGSLLIPEETVTSPYQETKPNTDTEQKFSAVIIISGSGPLDRDGNAGGITPPFNLYKALSEYIANERLAVVLKCDKRGVAKSADPLDVNKFWKAGMFDLVDDVLGQYEYLANHPKVNPEKIIVIGHSEGAILIPLIAKSIKEKLPNLPPLKYGIFVCGYAYTLDQCVRYQGSLIVRDIAMKPGFKAFILRKALLGKFFSDDWTATFNDARDKFVKEVVNSTEDYKSEMFGLKKINLKWNREHIVYGEKILEDLKEYTGNILAIGGEKDLQVDPKSCEKSCAPSYAPNAKSLEAKIIENLDHLLRIQTKPADMMRYLTEDMKTQIKLPVADSFIICVGDWIKNIS